MDPIVFVSLSITIGILYVLAYSFASFLFNYKIYLIGHEKYILGAIVSGMAIFINFTLYAFVPYIAIATSIPWLAAVLLVSLGIGAFFSSAVLSKVDLFHNKNKSTEEEKEGDQ